ncbi:Long-chain base-1-phosphate phosphatase [Coemansia sp. RSA 638]|nr:Long-chain base-1-phosphate phosphatase [Coemansia sp. RSA 638]
MPPHFQLDEDNDVIHNAEAFSLAPESAYQAVYSPLRLYLRQLVVDEVKRENPKLAAIQHRYRSPGLDRLFVFSGMLGNHSFFMIALPFFHTFGMGAFARGLTFVVLWSIYFSGAVKDYISAPRPASPPVVQITRSPAHTLEYGFPSTHTTYAVATIVYISHFMLNVWHISTVWVGLMWVCGATIVAGRIYCGLHSFIDVVGGIVIGAIEALGFVFFFDRLDALMLSTAGPLYSVAIFYFAMSSIPRSLDPCPCCIDSFCATSVTLGLSALSMSTVAPNSDSARSSDWAFKQLFKLESKCRSPTPALQVEAIGEFPKLLDQFPFPTLVSSAFLKLGDLFRSSPNSLRYHIAQVFGASQQHLAQITQTEELLKRILVVLYSNDPIARVLALRLIGNASLIFAKFPEAQHSILLRYQSSHPLEIVAAVQTTESMLSYSPEFLEVVWETVLSKADDPNVLDSVRVQLIRSLQHAAPNLMLTCLFSEYKAR